MVVVGRLLSGLAEGLLDVALMVLVARALPAVLRPRMFSLFAAMWILPSVLGPRLLPVSACTSISRATPSTAELTSAVGSCPYMLA